MTRLPSARTYHQRVWYHARTEQAEKCIRWSFDGFVLLPNFSQSLGAHANPQQPTILILVSCLVNWHWCPDYNTDTDVLIADPLSAGDEKLVLLLSPDSPPSSPHYAATHCVHVHHLLVHLCSQQGLNCRKVDVVLYQYSVPRYFEVQIVIYKAKSVVFSACVVVTAAEGKEGGGKSHLHFL